jgi:hypothetical protein
MEAYKCTLMTPLANELTQMLCSASLQLGLCTVQCTVYGMVRFLLYVP